MVYEFFLKISSLEFILPCANSLTRVLVELPWIKYAASENKRKRVQKKKKTKRTQKSSWPSLLSELLGILCVTWQACSQKYNLGKMVPCEILNIGCLHTLLAQMSAKGILTAKWHHTSVNTIHNITTTGVITYCIWNSRRWWEAGEAKTSHILWYHCVDIFSCKLKTGYVGWITYTGFSPSVFRTNWLDLASFSTGEKRNEGSLRGIG